MARIENNAADLLLAGGFAAGPDGSLKPLSADESGKLLPSSENSFAVQASGFDIRSLRADRDALAIASQSSVSASASAPVGLLVPVYFLPTDLSRMRQNVFVVANRALLSLSVRISLEIAPVNSDAYYVNDGASYDLVGGGIQAFKPSKLMRFARIRVSALLSTATVEVYYFGRS